MYIKCREECFVFAPNRIILYLCTGILQQSEEAENKRRKVPMEKYTVRKYGSLPFYSAWVFVIYMKYCAKRFLQGLPTPSYMFYNIYYKYVYQLYVTDIH